MCAGFQLAVPAAFAFFSRELIVGEWLSWKGYTVKNRLVLDAWSEGFSFPARFFEDVPYCIESYAQIRMMSAEKRLALQKKYMELTDQSVMGCIFVGLMRPDEAAEIDRQLKLCLDTMVRLVELLAQEELKGPRVAKMLACLSPRISSYLKTCLQSSCYYFTNDCGPIFSKVLEQPFYFELGTDILANKRDLLFSEFQVRYATPYPHLLTNMCSAYSELFPDIFSRFGLKADRFEQERNRLLSRSIEAFGSLNGDKPVPLLLDAWAYMQNSGANWIKLAQDLQMSYVLFDDLKKGQNIYEEAYRKKSLACFNQPPLSLVDPSHHAFARINAERLEDYDELEWAGLTDRYLKGEVFFANSPLTDIANDKAIYPALTELCRYFLDEELKLPIMNARPCWLPDDYRKPDEQFLAEAMQNKDAYVIAHRYLEGGLGIRVGRVTSQREWDAFIKTYVADRPYLFVMRDYFSMHPDLSHRKLSACYRENMLDGDDQTEIVVSDSSYVRFTTQSPLVADNHRCVLVMPASPGFEEPRYVFTEQ